MQQTQKYKLNLIESSDPFLPEALNQNTQKVEDVLKEKMEGPVAELDARVTVLEAHKFACGIYTGNYIPSRTPEEQFVPLPFTPKAVIVCKGREVCTYIEGYLLSQYLYAVQNGFRAGILINGNGEPFSFFAFR